MCEQTVTPDLAAEDYQDYKAVTGKCLSNGFKYFHAWRFLIFSQSSIFHLQFLFSDARKAGLDKNSENVPSEIWFTSTHRQRYQHHRWWVPATNQRPESVQHWPIRGRAMDLNDLTRYCSWEIVQAASTDLEFRQWAERGESGHWRNIYFIFSPLPWHLLSFQNTRSAICYLQNCNLFYTL